MSIILFCAALLLCLFFRQSIIIALAAGLFFFITDGCRRGHSLQSLFRMAADGIMTAKTVILTMAMIGALTALWRGCGTIPAIVCYSAGLLHPAVILLMCFILNCLVSFLIGTAFGTAATMGVVSMSIANAMGISPVLSGAAILSGVFFGDRGSPVSTSALLVSEITRTDIFTNIRKMQQTAFVPFLLSALFYLIAGSRHDMGGHSAAAAQILSANFNLTFPVLLPALAILTLSAMHISVKKSMPASILLSMGCAVFLQHMDIPALARTVMTGFHSPDPQVEALLGGGGVLSMLKVIVILALSSAYAGIFQGTDILSGLIRRLQALSERLSSFGVMLLSSLLSSMIACNQTLAIMLTDQLCLKLMPDPEERAIGLENSVVLISGLIPWSIAGAVPLSSVGAPLSAIAFAVYLYLVPVWYLGCLIWRRRHPRGALPPL